MKFKNLVSIGDNCEVGIQLVRLGYSKGSLFRYAASRLSDIVNFIENDGQGLFDKDNIKAINANMVRCLKYRFAFHTKFQIEKMDDGQFVLIDGQDEQYDREFEKLLYLKESFFSYLRNTSEPVLFIYRSRYSKFDDIYKFIELLEKRYPSLLFKVLLIKSKEQSFATDHEKIIVEEVKHLAIPGAEIKGADECGWNQISDKYFQI